MCKAHRGRRDAALLESEWNLRMAADLNKIKKKILMGFKTYFN